MVLSSYLERMQKVFHMFLYTFNKVFLSIIILALTINCIETVVKAVKYSRQ